MSKCEWRNLVAREQRRNLADEIATSKRPRSSPTLSTPHRQEKECFRLRGVEQAVKKCNCISIGSFAEVFQYIICELYQAFSM